MNRTAKLGIVAGVLFVIVLIVFGSGMFKEKKTTGLQAPKAVAYQCESCGYTFGIPTNVAVYPPIVCPKCTKRTAVRAHIYEPADGGPPKVFYFTKYSDAQIKIMEDAISNNEPDMLADLGGPEGYLAGMNDGPSTKAAGGNQWVTFAQGNQNPQLTVNLRGQIKRNRPIEVFPKDDPNWPIVDKDDVRQR